MASYHNDQQYQFKHKLLVLQYVAAVGNRQNRINIHAISNGLKINMQVIGWGN